MKSTRSLSTILLIGAFIIAAAIMSRSAMGTKAQTAGQGEIGVIDIYHLVDILIMSDDAAQERTDFEVQSSNQISAYEQQLIGIQTQMNGMSQDDPAAAKLISDYQQVNQQIQQATNQINTAYQTLLSQQIARAYTEIHAAANVVAAEQGYTFVLATRRGADLIQTTTLTGVTQEILARPLITPPQGADLTESVRMHMGLPTMEEITAAAEAAAAEALEAANQPVEPTPAVEITDDPTP